jgi:hypothetical protein
MAARVDTQQMRFFSYALRQSLCRSIFWEFHAPKGSVELYFENMIVENSYLAGILLINSLKYEKLENFMISVC